jgi:heme exporter protein B
MERLYQADLEDGTLDAYAGSGVSLEIVSLAKTAAHWIATGVPLALIAPVLWIMLQLPPESALFAALASVIGSAAFFFLGSIGAALAAGVRRGGLLIALVALPLYSPAMIFGAAALYRAAEGGSWGESLMLMGAASLFGVAISPFSSAAALRSAID